MSERDPFSDKSLCNRNLTQKQSKRTQRYKSTTKSRIKSMSVGDVRYSFCQLRAAGEDLSPDFVLYNGQKAGEFALRYLIETTKTTRKRRKKKRGYCSSSDSDNSDEVVDYPPSQLPNPENKKKECFTNFVDFS